MQILSYLRGKYEAASPVSAQSRCVSELCVTVYCCVLLCIVVYCLLGACSITWSWTRPQIPSLNILNSIKNLMNRSCSPSSQMSFYQRIQISLLDKKCNTSDYLLEIQRFVKWCDDNYLILKRSCLTLGGLGTTGLWSSIIKLLPRLTPLNISVFSPTL